MTVPLTPIFFEIRFLRASARTLIQPSVTDCRSVARDGQRPSYLIYDNRKIEKEREDFYENQGRIPPMNFRPVRPRTKAQIRFYLAKRQEELDNNPFGITQEPPRGGGVE